MRNMSLYLQICKSKYSKYMRDYDENKELLYLQYWDVHNLYGWAMSQKLPVNNFEWIGDTSQFNEDFVKSSNEISHKGYFLEVGVQYTEKLTDLYNDLPFLPEGIKIEQAEKLVANLHDKTERYAHKKFKTSIKSCISFKKSSQSD